MAHPVVTLLTHITFAFGTLGVIRKIRVVIQIINIVLLHPLKRDGIAHHFPQQSLDFRHFLRVRVRQVLQHIHNL